MHPYQAHLLLQTADVFDLWKLIKPAYTLNLLTELSSTAHRNILSRRGHRRGVQTELTRPWWLSKYRLATDEKASFSCCPIHKYHMKLKVKVKHRIKMRFGGIQSLNSQFQRGEREKRLQAQKKKQKEGKADAINKEQERCAATQKAPTQKAPAEYEKQRAKTDKKEAGSDLSSHGPLLMKAERAALQSIKSNMSSGRHFTGLRQLPRACQVRIKHHLVLGAKSRYADVALSTSEGSAGLNKASIMASSTEEDHPTPPEKTKASLDDQGVPPTTSQPKPTPDAEVIPLISKIVPDRTSSVGGITKPEASSDTSLSHYTRKIPEIVREFMSCGEIELQDSLYDEEAFRRLQELVGPRFIKKPWEHVV